MTQQFTEFSIAHTFPVKPEEIYMAWLDGQLHGKMTGSYAECRASEGSNFAAWDGYISGKNVTLIPGKKIIQAWRTTEFKERDEDSLVEIELKAVAAGCLFTLKHSRIPPGQPDYKQGWMEYYIGPMSEYFK